MGDFKTEYGCVINYLEPLYNVKPMSLILSSFLERVIPTSTQPPPPHPLSSSFSSSTHAQIDQDKYFYIAV